MKIFILEDDPNRINLFLEALNCLPAKDVTVCTKLVGSGGAVEEFKPPYDLLLLDHDLGQGHYLPSEGPEETGYQFVKWLASHHRDWADAGSPEVIVHSYNMNGADNMIHLLQEFGWPTGRLPFGPNLLRALTHKALSTLD